jgi:hypothetical protein
MKKANLLLMGLFALFFISSCTIQKRTVNKGYFVQWHWDKNLKSSSTESRAQIPAEAELEMQTEQVEVAEVENFIPTGFSENTDSKPGIISEEENQTIVPRTKKMTAISESIALKKPAVRALTQKIKKRAPMPMDAELAINILLLVVFLGLAILFTILAINVATGTMLYVWGALALLCFVLFVTQVIDVIMW